MYLSINLSVGLNQRSRPKAWYFKDEPPLSQVNINIFGFILQNKDLDISSNKEDFMNHESIH